MKNSEDPNQDKNQSVANETDETNEAYNKYIDPDYQEKQKKKKLMIIAIVAFAILAVTILVAVIAASLSSPSEPSSGNNLTNENETSDFVTAVCEDEACFEEKFSLCQPAKYEGQGPEESSTVEYAIPGVQNVGCLVSLKYLDSKDKEIIGKEMTCDFDNESSFREALALADEYPQDHECEGSLIDFYDSAGDKARSLYGI